MYRKDTVLCHLCHEVIVVEEQETNDCDDEKHSTSGLWREKEQYSRTEQYCRVATEQVVELYLSVCVYLVRQ